MAELKAAGEAVYKIGKIRARQGDEAQTLVV
jgi:phosphoribosylformylglycinamidine cyclo-ligase